MQRFTLVGLVGAALVLLVACSAPTPPKPTYTPVPHADTRVLDAAARGALQGYDEASGVMTFSGSALPALAVGNVVVSEPTPAAPYGILRRVTGVDASVAGELTVQTEAASLDMALESGSLYESFTMTPDDIVAPEYYVEGLRLFDPAAPAERERLAAASADGVAPLALPKGFIGLELVDVVLYDVDGDLSTKNDRVVVNGDLGIAPVFNIDFALNCSYLCLDTNPYFKFEVGGQALARLALETTTPDKVTLTKKVPLATLTGTTISFWIGPVPVVIVPKLKLELQLDGTVGFSLGYEVQETLTLKAGGQYKDGNWSNISEASHEGVAQPVKSGSLVHVVAKAKLKGSMRAELLLYGVIGTYAELVPYVGIDVEYPRDPIWRLSAGLEANAGVVVDVWLFDKEWAANLIKLEWAASQSDNTAPELTILTAGPVQVGPNGINLRATVFDAEDGTSCCTTTFRSSNVADGNAGLLGSDTGSAPEVAVTFATTGTRTISVTAADSSGKETSKTLDLSVVNTPPELTITSPYEAQQFSAGQSVRFKAYSYDPNEAGFAVPCDQLVWSAGAVLGTGCNLTVDEGFAQGSPTVTLTATDGNGATSTVQVGLAIGPAPANYPPRVSVNSPQDNKYVGQFEELTLDLTAVDPEDDAITAYVWDALLDYSPSTGTGGTSYDVVPDVDGHWSVSQLPGYANPVCGVDTLIRLRVRVTDAQGSVGQDFVVLRFTVIC